MKAIFRKFNIVGSLGTSLAISNSNALNTKSS